MKFVRECYKFDSIDCYNNFAQLINRQQTMIKITANKLHNQHCNAMKIDENTQYKFNKVSKIKKQFRQTDRGENIKHQLN